MGTALSLLEIEGVSAVEVGVVGQSVAVLVPHCANVVLGLEPQRIRVLAQAVEIGVLGQAGPKAQVLRLEHERRRRSIEENLLGVGAADLEGEGRLGVVKLEFVGPGGALASWPLEDGFRDLVDLVVLVLNRDVNAVIWTWMSARAFIRGWIG